MAVQRQERPHQSRSHGGSCPCLSAEVPGKAPPPASLGLVGNAKESWAAFRLCTESDAWQQYPCPEKQWTFLSKAVSCLFTTRRTNKEDCTYFSGRGPIRPRKSEGKKGGCCMTGRKTPISVSLWCSVTSQLRLSGNWDPDLFAVTPEPPGVQMHLEQY